MEMKIHFKDKAKVIAEYKGFTVVTDQPEQSGGDNTAPSPFDYFLISLATCAGIYLRRFIEGRGISSDGVSLTLNTEKDREKQLISKVTIDASFPPSFPDKYKDAVLNTMNLCAVKKHIANPPQFITNILIDGKVVASSGK